MAVHVADLQRGQLSQAAGVSMAKQLGTQIRVVYIATRLTQKALKKVDVRQECPRGRVGIFTDRIKDRVADCYQLF